MEKEYARRGREAVAELAGQDDEVLVRGERPSLPDEAFHCVRRPRVHMREQDRVVLCRVQFPVCLIGEFGGWVRWSHLEIEMAEVQVYLLYVKRIIVII